MMSCSRFFPIPVPRSALAAGLAGLAALTAAPPAAWAAGIARASRPAVARIALAASRSQLLVGDTTTLQATAYDAQGNTLPGARFSFRVSSRAVRVSAAGVVVGARFGSANVWAVVGKVKSNSVAFDVTRVAQVTVTPATAPPLHAGETALFQATAVDPKGAALPGVPITWSSSNVQVATVSNSGAMRAESTGTTQLVAAAGKVKSLPVNVTVSPRPESKATRVFLRDAPGDGFGCVCVTIAQIEAQDTAGNWVTLLTGAEINALVGQPIDVLKLQNLKQLIGTAVLPNGDYQAVRVTLSTADGANFVTDPDGSKIDLPVAEEDAAFEMPLEFTVADGHPTNLVIDFSVADSIFPDDAGGLMLVPSCLGDAQDDPSAEAPIGSIVGVVTPAGMGSVLAVRTDGETGDPEPGIGFIDADTGAFRIGGLPAGTYELHVQVNGFDEVVVGGVVVLDGQDTVLPDPIAVNAGPPQ
jgi:Domain of unknown function (DUF4382)/Bacterial Ig-like domain (group 2)